MDGGFLSSTGDWSGLGRVVTPWLVFRGVGTRARTLTWGSPGGQSTPCEGSSSSGVRTACLISSIFIRSRKCPFLGLRPKLGSQIPDYRLVLLGKDVAEITDSTCLICSLSHGSPRLELPSSPSSATPPPSPPASLGSTSSTAAALLLLLSTPL